MSRCVCLMEEMTVNKMSVGEMSLDEMGRSQTRSMSLPFN